MAKSKGGAQLVVFPAIEPEVALGHLRDLVALRDCGLTQPLRLPLKTGFSLMRWGDRAATKEWVGSDLFEGERDKDHHPQIWGPRAPYDVLLDAPDDLTVRALAERLWRPILQAGVTP